MSGAMEVEMRSIVKAGVGILTSKIPRVGVGTLPRAMLESSTDQQQIVIIKIHAGIQNMLERDITTEVTRSAMRTSHAIMRCLRSIAQARARLLVRASAPCLRKTALAIAR